MSDFEDVRDASGKLLFRIDKERSLIEIARRGQKVLIDLQAKEEDKRKEGGNNVDTG